MTFITDVYSPIDGGKLGNEERSLDGRRDVVQNSRLKSEPLAEAGARTDLEMCFQIFIPSGTVQYMVPRKRSGVSAMLSSMHVVYSSFKGMVGPEIRWWGLDHVIELDEGEGCKWESRREHSSRMSELANE